MSSSKVFILKILQRQNKDINNQERTENSFFRITTLHETEVKKQ